MDSTGKLYSCATQNDCFGWDLCTAEHTCVCEAAKGASRCGAASSGCLNLWENADNCGQCGHSCGMGEECVKGRCSSFACPRGETKCHLATGADYCANLKEENSDCGACDHACAPFLVCVGGRCKKEE